MITVQPSENIKDGIAKLIAASIEDYNRDTNNEKMKEEFANSWSVKEGPKFIKLVAKHSVHSFIVKKAFKHFKEGDVLKAASWKAPAKHVRFSFQNEEDLRFLLNPDNVGWAGGYLYLR